MANISQQRLLSIKITKLKQLEDFECDFDINHNITAILGINGCGKSTVLHALACCFKPCNGNGENYKFSAFFLPNNYNTWQGSSFSIKYSYRENTTVKTDQIKEYKKTSDRWTHYETRPERPVYYIGIDTCVPDIEKEKITTRIRIGNISPNGVLSSIINEIGVIMNEHYEMCSDGNNHNKHYKILKRDGLEYPSIAMGAGEQRLLRILETIYSAPSYSLILIDELDLTLHTSAFNRLLDKLVNLCASKKIQIIFTTHRESITQRTDINIRHFHKVGNKTFCFNGVNNACMEALTGVLERKINVFVEDLFSKAIIQTIAEDLKILKFCNINTFGSIDNGFTIASAIASSHSEAISNNIIVLDGDKYTTDEEKRNMLNSRFGGNTEYEINIREMALNLISEYNSNSKSPDNYIIDLIKNDDGNTEIHEIVKTSILNDAHEYAQKICDNLGIHKDRAYEKMINIVKDKSEWLAFVQPVKEWLENKKQELHYCTTSV